MEGDMKAMRCWETLLFAAALASAVLCGCRKSERQLAEQRALERHERESNQRKAIREAIQGPHAGQVFTGVRFLKGWHDNGQLPGLSAGNHGQLFLGKMDPAPGGGFVFSQEYEVVMPGSEEKHFHYVLGQTSSNADFQLLKAWRSDAAGDTLERFSVPRPSMPERRRAFLGPVNAGAEVGFALWYHGNSGSASVAVNSEDSASGFNCFRIGVTDGASDRTNHADLRSVPFSLGQAAQAGQPMQFKFAYKLPGQVKAGDDIEVYLRFFDLTGTNFLDQQRVAIGANTGDSEMTRFKTVTVSRIIAPANARTADIWVVANIFGPWSSGTAEFDDFSVTVAAARSCTGMFVGAGIIAALAAGMAGWLFLRRRQVEPTTRSGP